MPITYQIDVALRIVVAHGSETVNDKDLLQLLKDLKVDPNFNPNFNFFADYSQANIFDVRSETIHYVASQRIFNVSSLRAFVVKPGLQYGFARMFQILREPEDSNIRVFTELAEARKWLGWDK